MDREFEIGDKVIVNFNDGVNYHAYIIEHCRSGQRFKVRLYGYHNNSRKDSISIYTIQKKYMTLNKQYYREKRLKQLLDKQL